MSEIKKKIEIFKSVLTPINILNDLYQMVYDFHNISELIKFEYITDGGGLLGAIKYGSIISYDDDFDVCYISNIKNNEKLKILFNLMKNLGYSVYYQIINGGYQIVSNRINNKFPFIDIIPLTKIKKNTYIAPLRTFLNPKFNKWLSWNKNDLFPRKLYSYCDIKIWGPANPYEYLEKMYPKWKIISEYQGKHTYYNAISLFLEYFSENHISIETEKIPIEIQFTKNLIIKYNTIEKLKKKIIQEYSFSFKISQLFWFRILY